MKKLASQKELKKLLQAGYILQQEKNAYQVHRVPRSGEPGFSRKSFGDYIRFGANGHIDYRTYTESIKNTFVGLGLNFTKFTSKTETINSEIEPDSPAGNLIRQLRELDTIITKPNVFESYILPKTHEKVEFKNEKIRQGYAEHKFRDNVHRKLLHLLWDNRRIESPAGKILKKEKTTNREVIYKELKIDHERFKDIVRAIKMEMKRKEIDLDVKYPKDVLIVVRQDSM